MFVEMRSDEKLAVDERVRRNVGLNARQGERCGDVEIYYQKAAGVPGFTQSHLLHSSKGERRKKNDRHEKLPRDHDSKLSQISSSAWLLTPPGQGYMVNGRKMRGCRRDPPAGLPRVRILG